jgi:hypothetical protein
MIFDVKISRRATIYILDYINHKQSIEFSLILISYKSKYSLYSFKIILPKPYFKLTQLLLFSNISFQYSIL